MVLLSYFQRKECDRLLVLHLPLTGNVHNQGLLNEEVEIQQNLVWSDAGKLGKCIQFNGNANQILSFANVPKKINNFTWACWAKQINRISTTYNHTKQYILSNGRDCGSIGFNIFIQNGMLTIHMGSGLDDGSTTSTTNSVRSIQELQLNTWYHICCAVNDSNVMVYINGELIKTLALVDINFRSNFESYFTIGKMAYGHRSTTIYFPFDGYIQDVRVYDTCLSQRQVKEISKGLVCHYPLGEVDGKIGGRNLLSNSDFIQSSGEWVVESGASSLIEDSYFNKKVMSFNLTGGNKRIYKSLNNVWDKNQKYSVSFYAKASISGVAIQPSRSLIDVGEQINLTTSWKKYHTIILSTETVNGGTLSLQVNNSSATYYITNIKLEKGTSTTPWTPAPEDDPIMYDNVIYDTSGYGNNGRVSGTIAWDNDSTRYKGAYDFNGTGYIKNSNFNISFKEFTISYWIKIPESITAQHFAFGTFNSWTNNGVGSYRDKDSKVYNTIARSDTETNYGNFNAISLTPNTWYFVSFVYTGTTLKTYINGKIYGNIITYGKNGNVNMPVLYIGNSLFYGTPNSETDESSVVDFRIYATALDNQTIEELYKVRASVDNNGNLMLAGEVIEE